ncbi:MAG: SemiSWEET transporter [Deltaproteobacteria bacterium]|nr:SemiSWEET transporter [Deltaproteobacteria bacterium]
MDFITILGLTGGALTTASFLPQVVKTWKTRSAKDVSLGMFLILSLGILIWIAYGFMINSLPVIIANIISFFLTAVIVVLKLSYK